MITLISCLDMANGIGDSEGNLLFKIPEDVKHFRSTTNGGICIFGRKTAESLPNKKPLPNRRNILMTRDLSNSLAGFESIADISEILKLSKDNDVFICGGGEIYNQFIHHADRMILTHVHEFNFDARVFFPDFSPKDWAIEDMEKYKESKRSPSFTIANYIKK